MILWLIGFLPLVFVSQPSFSEDWICREGSSQLSGDTLLACGSAQASSEQEAKDKSRQAALREFRSLRDSSDTCKQLEVSVNPKRTECSKEGDLYTCYRAIEFVLSNHKKKDVLVDVHQVESQISNLSNEISGLESKLSKLRELKSKNENKSEIEQKIFRLEKSLNLTEGQQIELSQKIDPESVSDKDYKYTHLLYKNSVRFGVGYNSWKLRSSEEVNLSGFLSYEYRIFHFLGLQAGYSFGGDFSGNQKTSASDVPRSGTPNSMESFKGSLRSNEYSLSVLTYTPWFGSYLKAEIGQISGRRTNYSVSYNSLGIGSVSETTESFSHEFWGLGLGIDSRDEYKGFGGFFEVGGRSRPGDFGVVLTTGINYGF